MKRKLLIIGASGHGKVCAGIAIQMKKWDQIFFLDNNKKIKKSLGLDVIGNSDQISDFVDDYEIFVGIGNNEIRKKYL